MNLISGIWNYFGEKWLLFPLLHCKKSGTHLALLPYSEQGGAIMARMTINSLAVSTGKGLWPPEFMTLFLFMFEWSHKSHFSILFFKFLKNRIFYFWQFRHQRIPPLIKNRKFIKTNFFFKKLYFFFLNLYSTSSKLSFEVYNSHVSKNFKFWPIFTWKISFFAIVFWQPAWPKLQFIKYFFWCLWTAKDQKI